MPTGYTAPIKDGITFEQFAMGCARAFGALVMMREESSDAPIPDAFEPSDYNAKKLQEKNERLAWLRQIPDAEADREARNEYEADCLRHSKTLKDAKELKAKYVQMLAEVYAWNPPTTEHQGLKDFMVKQISESIDFDCGTEYYSEPKLMTAAEWKQANLFAVERDIAYHTKGHQEEVERTNTRNEWLRDLRNSLKATS